MTDRPTPRRERRDKTPEQALAALMRLCARAEKSSGDALRLMRTWGVAEEARREVLRKLTAQGFIDDARYAGAFVRDKIRLAGWGARKIRTAEYYRAMALTKKKAFTIPQRQVVGDHPTVGRIVRDTCERNLREWIAKNLDPKFTKMNRK